MSRQQDVVSPPGDVTEDDTRQCFSAGSSGPKHEELGRTDGRTGGRRVTSGDDELWVLKQLRSTETKRCVVGRSVRMCFVSADGLWGPTERTGRRLLSPRVASRVSSSSAPVHRKYGFYFGGNDGAFILPL